VSNFANLRFRHFAEGRQRAPKLRLPQAKQEIRLIFSWINAFSQNSAVRMMFDDRVMPRRDIIAVQSDRFAPEISELELFIADHAWIWRPPSLILTREIIDHESFKLIRFIDHVMRNA